MIIFLKRYLTMWIEEAVGGEATSEELPKETPKSEIGEKEERGEGERES